jgi:hypothetical protein
VTDQEKRTRFPDGETVRPRAVLARYFP